MNNAEIQKLILAAMDRNTMILGNALMGWREVWDGEWGTHFLAAGRHLNEAKSLLPPDEWEAWVAENFPFPFRMAEIYSWFATHEEEVRSGELVEEAVELLREYQEIHP